MKFSQISPVLPSNKFALKKITNIQKLSPIDSIVLKEDHEMISKICINFNQIIQIILRVDTIKESKNRQNRRK